MSRPFKQLLAKDATIKWTILNRRESRMRARRNINPGLPPVNPSSIALRYKPRRRPDLELPKK
jgi:hypothetical protein